MDSFAIGVDLGGTNLRIAAVSADGTLLESISSDTEAARGRDHVALFAGYAKSPQHKKRLATFDVVYHSTILNPAHKKLARVRHCCDAVLISISAYRSRYIDYSELFIITRGIV